MSNKKSLIKNAFESFLQMILIGIRGNKYSPLQLAKHTKEEDELSIDKQKNK